MMHGLIRAVLRYRVIALEVPGFGTSAENTRSASYPQLAATLVSAAQQNGAQRFRLWGTSFGGAVALWMAIGAPDAVEALVLEAPGAILADGGIRPSNTPEEMRSRLYAHPERQPIVAPHDPDVMKKQRALLERLERPSRQETEAQLASLNTPTLVVFDAPRVVLGTMVTPAGGRSAIRAGRTRGPGAAPAAR